MFKFSQLFNLQISEYPSPSPVDPLLDAEATIADSIPPQGKGKVRIFGSYWPAKMDTPTKWEIPVGTRVIVQRREGLTLIVKVLIVHNPQLTELSPRQPFKAFRTAA